jgi:hypothetical protein
LVCGVFLRRPEAGVADFIAIARFDESTSRSAGRSNHGGESLRLPAAPFHHREIHALAEQSARDPGKFMLGRLQTIFRPDIFRLA